MQRDRDAQREWCFVLMHIEAVAVIFSINAGLILLLLSSTLMPVSDWFNSHLLISSVLRCLYYDAVRFAVEHFSFYVLCWRESSLLHQVIYIATKLTFIINESLTKCINLG